MAMPWSSVDAATRIVERPASDADYQDKRMVWFLKALEAWSHGWCPSLVKGVVMSRNLRVFAVATLLVLVAAVAKTTSTAASAQAATQKFHDGFNTIEVLEETGSMSESASPHWWLSSGGRLHIRSRAGATIQGRLPTNDYWRRYYGRTSAGDTDGGFLPQNLFRLVTRLRWHNFRQQVYFRVHRDNLLDTPSRGASNGLFLMNRYLDADNLYYTGIRVDGAAVIKKKYQGRYYTLAYTRVFPGSDWDRDGNPNLLPKNLWVGLRSDVTSYPNGSVRIVLDVDLGPGGWVPAFSVIDDGHTTGPALTAPGFAGVRTDFMDVEFENYWVVPRD